MKQQNSTRAMVESGILAGVAVILVLISLYVPVLSLVTMFLWPIPITLVYIRHNLKYSILSLIITAILTAMFSDPLTALMLTGIFGLTNVVFGYCVKNNKSVATTIVSMSITYFLSMLLALKGFSLFMGQDIVKQMIDMVSKSVEMTKSLYLNLGMPADQVDKLIKALPSPDIIRLILPGALVLSSIVVSVITYVLSKNIFKRFGYNLNKFRIFSEWYIPLQIAMGLIIITFIGYIMNARGIPYGQGLFTNSVMIFSMTFSLNGLAAAAFFMKNRGMAKGLIFVILFFVAFSPLGNLLIYVGMFDYVLDYRKLDPSRRRQIVK